MRVIGGKFRSRKLKTLKGDNTRPTADKIKGAIFSSIAFDTNYNIMLDLFAGSGAMGIEALSRGFKYVYFNDSSKLAINVIKDNLNSLDLFGQSKVYTYDYNKCIKIVAKHSQVDFVFIDPPYGKIDLDKVFDLIISSNLIADNGIVCVETSNKESLATNYGDLEKYKEKNYKSTNVTYYIKKGSVW